MAAGALVPHTLPDGRTIMVPEHLAPKGPALALPSVPAPSAGPDMRVAGPGGGLASVDTGGDIDPGVMEDMRQQAQVKALRDQLAPKTAPPTNEHPRPASKLDELAKLGAKGGGDAVDPSTLAIRQPPQQAPQGEAEGEYDPMVRKVFNEALSRGGGGGPRRQVGTEVGSIRIEREPGKELLPEYKWMHGLEARPDLGEEVDPDAVQPTWGGADPVMRPRKTALERGAEASGEAARSEFQRQVTEQQQLGLAQREQLAAQSQLIDEQLNTIAQRRERIAKLQEAADKRMQEAESFEPRSREQVWEQKGGIAQVMGVLAMAIGGYTQGLGRNGGRNPGMDIINKVIDSAVEDDRAKYERRRKVGLEARGDFERALSLYGDLDMATLDARNRKLASAMAMTKQMLADRSLDATAKARGEQVYAMAQEQYLANKQQLFDQIVGKVTKEETNLKPTFAGGGGGGATTLKALEDAARAKKAISTISGGEQSPYQRSIEGDKLNDVNAAMEALDAADAVERDLKALGVAGSDFDDPLSGPLDAAAKVVGTGGTGRRRRQSLEANTSRLARGIQQSLGKSDNDARLADEMAVGDGSGLSRAKAAETARRQALGRIQTATAGMTPQQREAFLQALPPERRELVRGALSANATPKRSATEAPLE